MSQIVVSCEMPILMGTVYCTCSSAQFVPNAIFMSLQGPAGACIPVASGSPFHVPPVCVLKHCGVHQACCNCNSNSND